jgi:hypothetical protein
MNRRENNMKTTLLTEILATLLGRKYYANITYWRSKMGHQEMSSFIFATKEEAYKHRDGLVSNRSFGYVTTISFRTREKLKCTTYAEVLKLNN